MGYDAEMRRAMIEANRDEYYEREIERLRDEIRLLEGCHHPGYVIGYHWLASAYRRICAGEDEATVLADHEYVRVKP